MGERPLLEVADVIRRHGAEFRQRYGHVLAPGQRRVLAALAA
jgi:hypothetical protein